MADKYIPLGPGENARYLKNYKIVGDPETNQILQFDGTHWTVVSAGGSTGDVVGPSSSYDNSVPRFDSTTGKLIQGSGVLINDDNNVQASSVSISNNGAGLLFSILPLPQLYFHNCLNMTSPNAAQNSSLFIESSQYAFCALGICERSIDRGLYSSWRTITGGGPDLPEFFFGTQDFAGATPFTLTTNFADRNLYFAGSYVEAGKHLIFNGASYTPLAGDNNIDIGSKDNGTSLNRPRRVYVGTSINIGVNTNQTGYMYLGAKGALISGNTAGDILITPNSGSVWICNSNLYIGGQIYSEQDSETQEAGNTHAINWNDGNNTEWDLQNATGNITLTMTNPKNGASYNIIIIQGSTARDIIWPVNVLWAANTPPVISTNNNAIDLVKLYYTGANYLGSFVQDLS